MVLKRSEAPWTIAQMTSIRAFQTSGMMHPFTCPNRGDGGHKDWGEGDVGVLVAHVGALHCRDCEYVQTWVHEFMAEWDVHMNEFPLPDGRVLHTHSIWKCNGEFCAIHNPSEHHMRTWPLNFRDDRGVMERICPHGIGHPDPDGLVFQVRIGREPDEVHGCDGCCRP